MLWLAFRGDPREQQLSLDLRYACSPSPWGTQSSFVVELPLCQQPQRVSAPGPYRALEPGTVDRVASTPRLAGDRQMTGETMEDLFIETLKDTQKNISSRPSQVC